MAGQGFHGRIETLGHDIFPSSLVKPRHHATEGQTSDTA
ncbi:hypothetical protein SACS_0240 [Parasaccharibacter apium]|uniref:Uncharacterized protein n=1 Tax=Parasaccharibacter apium TaxID=1510841 RepID=A0A7U7G4I1_9PROT|nr:hypothetical protein SACS_0240 [Parasaccharibacter apium]